MSTTTPLLSPRRAAAAVVVAVALLTSGCSGVGDALGLSGTDAEPSTPTGAAPAVATEEELPYESQFTRDGTFQSHTDVDGLDFVYTLYPTKATPRTHEWYPKGDKFFSFTFQAYDLRRELRDPFDTKREVYLGTIKVESRVRTPDRDRVPGKKGKPYTLDANAQEVTFDPEPESNRYGMLVTSPKGAFELRNQAIGSVPDDAVGLDLRFTAITWVETAPGSDDFRMEVVKQTVPVALFPSDTPTRAEKIAFTAN